MKTAGLRTNRGLHSILFFWTTILSIFVAHKHGEEKREEMFGGRREVREVRREVSPRRRSRSRSYDVERGERRERQEHRHHRR